MNDSMNDLKNIYLDNAASTKVRDEAVEAMVRVMKDIYGNPSSMHRFGRQAGVELENARANVASALGADSNNMYFTSGGTEANNWAILGAAQNIMRKGNRKQDRRHIITSATEHSAVLDPIKMLESKGWEVTYLPPDSSGRISSEAFSNALRDDTALASIMLVNNEVGAVNPVGDYSREIKQRGLATILHTDAIQGLCKIPFSVKSLGADLVTVSSHKLHGPKGVGAIYIKDKIKLTPLILGGNHEKGLRGGTEALPAAVGFGVAARLGMSEFINTAATVCDLRECMSGLIKTHVPGVIFIGESGIEEGGGSIGEGVSAEGDSSISEGGGSLFDRYSPFILCISLPGFMSETLMNFLDEKGIFVSRSAACKKGARSRTLEAMRLNSDVIDGSLRVSFSRYSTREEVEYFVRMLKEASETLYKKF